MNRKMLNMIFIMRCCFSSYLEYENAWNGETICDSWCWITLLMIMLMWWR